MTLPWNFKMVYGFVSDTFPIYGLRRKPYMLGGSIVCALAWLILSALDGPGLATTCFFVFLSIFGMIFEDVMADALVVERMRVAEKDNEKGGIQSICWMLRFSGGITGYLAGGWLLQYAGFSPQAIFALVAVLPLLLLLPSLYFLKDKKVTPTGATFSDEAHAKIKQMWECIQHNSIWMPMLFVFTFCSTPSSADAFANFLLGPRCFTDRQYTYILAIGETAVASSVSCGWMASRCESHRTIWNHE